MAKRRHLAVLFLWLMPLLAAYGQVTSLVASVDRELIRANESFSYTLRAEGRFSGRPDLSAVTRDFDLVQSGSSASIEIVNGQTAQIAEWKIELMPRGTGEFELPAIELGDALSNGVSLEILPAATDDETGADVFLEVEIDRSEAYVQAEAIYTLRLFVGITIGREELSGLPITGGEAIVERLGSDSDYQIVRGDRVYRVRERKFAIFPQTAGQLSIGPVEYRATVTPRLGFSRRQDLLSDVVELTVKPAVLPPPTHPNAVWLPARNVRIEEQWRDGVIDEQGVPRTRELTIVANGLLETQLPELELAASDGLRQYVDQPELSRQITDDGIEARRSERFAVIAQQPGTIEFPAVELPWWNVDEERWEIARIDSTSVEVEPAFDAEAPAATLPPPGSAPTVESTRDFWPWLAGGLALGWLATVAAWAFSRRDRQRIHASRSRPRTTSARALQKQLSAACRVDDAQRTRDLLMEWAARQFADDPPPNLGALVGRLTGPLADEIATLESALYGRKSGSWSGQQLEQLLKNAQSVTVSPGAEGENPLVPLYR